MFPLGKHFYVGHTYINANWKQHVSIHFRSSNTSVCMRKSGREREREKSRSRKCSSAILVLLFDWQNCWLEQKLRLIAEAELSCVVSISASDGESKSDWMEAWWSSSCEWDLLLLTLTLFRCCCSCSWCWCLLRWTTLYYVEIQWNGRMNSHNQWLSKLSLLHNVNCAHIHHITLRMVVQLRRTVHSVSSRERERESVFVINSKPLWSSSLLSIRSYNSLIN